jgi:hypothetical protein
VLTGVNDFDEHAVRTLLERGEGGVNDRHISAQVLRRLCEVLPGHELQGHRDQRCWDE